MMERSGAIGVFDSGFGGLHVLRGIVQGLPQYDYIYLGDSHRAPYGGRPQNEVLEFTRQGVDFLFAQGAEIVLVACNTASSEALRVIQKSSTKKVLGVLVPFVQTAVAKSCTKRIGVIATEGTVRSGAYVREITKIDPSAVVIQQACPRLVLLVEAGEQDSELAKHLIKEYLRTPLESGIDTLILGCTHYGILEVAIREAVGPDIQIISERDVMPPKLKDYLARHVEIEGRLTQGSTVRCYTTGSIENFNTLGSEFFGAPVDARLAKLTYEL